MVRRVKRKGVAEGDLNAEVGSSDCGWRQERIRHFRKHTWNPLALVSSQSQVNQYPDDARVTTAVNTLQLEQLFQCQVANQIAGTGYFHTVIE